ncbi:MAG: glycogen debranching enzyme N-terminal domain-containing protein [Planctomycetes bacterium]|nr:glycogen debranching enzyme N-terminal domain-containing protein [Planctomycetota bacterium]
MHTPLADRDWSLTNPHIASSSGSLSGIRHSREQALLAARDAVSGKTFALVNGFEAWVVHEAGQSSLGAQRYAPGTVNPDEQWRCESFTEKPWPAWRTYIDPGAHVTQEIQLVPGRALVALRWSLVEDLPGFSIHVRPFLSGREIHALHHRNPSFRAGSSKRGWKVAWHPYDAVPEIDAYCKGAFDVDPHWYERFQYNDGSTEDLFAPGVFHGPLRFGSPFELILAAGWDEVVGGMILPEQPVLWAEEAPVARVKVVKKKKKVTKAKVVAKKTKKAARKPVKAKRVVRKAAKKVMKKTAKKRR